jgi:hypothetical protein
MYSIWFNSFAAGKFFFSSLWSVGTSHLHNTANKKKYDRLSQTLTEQEDLIVLYNCTNYRQLLLYVSINNDIHPDHRACEVSVSHLSNT